MINLHQTAFFLSSQGQKIFNEIIIGKPEKTKTELKFDKNVKYDLSVKKRILLIKYSQNCWKGRGNTFLFS